MVDHLRRYIGCPSIGGVVYELLIITNGCTSSMRLLADSQNNKFSMCNFREGLLSDTSNVKALQYFDAFTKLKLRLH